MLDERVRDRIIAETRGNPLALLELPRGLTATQLAGGFGMPGGACALRTGSRRATSAGSRPFPRTRGFCCWSRRPSRSAIRCSCCAHPSDSGSAVSAVDATDGLLDARERVTFRHPLVRSAVYRSADAAERRAAHLALGGGDRSKADPDRRAWHLAAAAAGSRRGGRAGAGAVGGPGAGARRPRRGGRIPAARGRADRRSRAASRPGARRRPGQPGRGRVRPGARAARGSGGRAAGRAPARPPGPAARRGRLLREPRKRGSGAAPSRRQDAGAPRSRARARDVSRRVELGALRRTAREHHAACTTSRARRGRPRPGASAASVGSAAGRLRAGVHGWTLRGGTGARPGGDRLRGRRRLGRGGAALGVARDRGRGDGVGLRDLPRGCRVAGPSSPATRAR